MFDVLPFACTIPAVYYFLLYQGPAIEGFTPKTAGSRTVEAQHTWKQHETRQPPHPHTAGSTPLTACSLVCTVGLWSRRGGQGG